MFQRFCQTQAHSEVKELLHGLRRRLELLGRDYPQLAVADNCCHVRTMLIEVFPDIWVGLDVWHFMMRYVSDILCFFTILTIS